MVFILACVLVVVWAAFAFVIALGVHRLSEGRDRHDRMAARGRRRA